jgi:uncharacterized protein YdhG (YjbR/CyaY superfamily)
MKSSAQTVDEYLLKIPGKRKEAMSQLRELCRKFLPDHAEDMTYNMPSYVRNGQVEVAFASQKQYISVYFLIHQVMLDNAERLEELNTGKGCIRFTNPARIDYGLITDLLVLTNDTDAKIC